MSTDTVDSTGQPPEVPGPFGAPVPSEEAGRDPAGGHPQPLRLDGRGRLVGGAGLHAGRHHGRAVRHGRGRLRRAGGHLDELRARALHRHLLLPPQPEGPGLRRLATRGCPSWCPRTSGGSTAGCRWPPACSSASRPRSSPAPYTLQFVQERNWISATTANDLGYQAIVAGLWLALITFICIWGIRWTTNFQWVLLIIEYVAVIGFSIWGIIKVAASSTRPDHQGFHFGVAQPVLDRELRGARRPAWCSASSSSGAGTPPPT